MLATDNIRQIPTDSPAVYAFEIDGAFGADDLRPVAELLDDAFDRHDSINMLLILNGVETADASAGFDPRSLKTQLRGLTHVARYAVVGAPPVAGRLIDAFDALSTIEAQTFDADEEDAAWRFVGARPAA